MQKKDYLIKAIDQDKQVRIFLARTTALVEEAHRRHHTSATASAALGRVMTATVMMGSDLKNNEDRISMAVRGNGPAGTVLASADCQGSVRGFIANPSADLPEKAAGKLDVGGIIGREGYLQVRKDLGLKQPFTGQVSLVSGEIGEDLASYFLQSEQIPSLVSLGVLVEPHLNIQAAGGLLIQALPGAEDRLLAMLEEQVAVLGAISTAVDQFDNLEDILSLLMKDIPYRLIEKKDLTFQCNCSREKLGKIVADSTSKELDESFADSDKIEVVCNFCAEKYCFTRQEIDAIRFESFKNNITKILR